MPKLNFSDELPTVPPPVNPVLSVSLPASVPEKTVSLPNRQVAFAWEVALKVRLMEARALVVLRVAAPVVGLAARVPEEMSLNSQTCSSNCVELTGRRSTTLRSAGVFGTTWTQAIDSSHFCL